MIQGPSIEIAAGRNRMVHLGLVTQDCIDKFLANPVPDPKIQEVLMADLYDDDTTSWGVRCIAGRGNRQKVQTIGVVAISDYDRIFDEDGEVDFAHAVWFGGTSGNWPPRYQRRLAAGTIAVAAATGYGLQQYEALYLLAYQLNKTLNIVHYIDAEKLGYEYIEPVYVGNVGIWEMVVDQCEYDEPADNNYLLPVLRRLSQRLMLTENTEAPPASS